LKKFTVALALNLVSALVALSSPVLSQPVSNAVKQNPASPPPVPGSVNPSLPADGDGPVSPAPAKGSSLKYSGGPTSGITHGGLPAKSVATVSGSPANMLAQRAPRPQGVTPVLPSVVGTVQIRKAFKLFASQNLIHNMSFRDTPVREVIGELARRGNLNILIDKSVTGKITGELRDVTLNEALDDVLASAGLQSRVLDNNTVIVGTLQSMVVLGLNRPMARAFKLSYAHPYDVATMLHASIFNRGYLPDFTKRLRNFSTNEGEDKTSDERARKAGGVEADGDVATQGEKTSAESERTDQEQENNQISRPDVNRTVRGSSRSQTQEGVGFNNAATDPGSQQIRAFQEVNTDYIVEQNGGGAIVIPDVKNRQVIVVGTQDDINLAEESIRLIDRRPRQVHITTSFVELNNAGIRQLGASINAQGKGVSSTVMGGSPTPLVNTLAGQAANFVGAVLPTGTQQAAQVIAVPQSLTALNFLTLGRQAGGAGNIATFPDALNVTLNLLLQTNKAKLVANPSVVVVDNTESLITIATEVIHKVTSTVSLGVVTTNVELTKAGIFLNVLPKVTEDGFITMRLRPQVSLPTSGPITFGSSSSPTIVTLLTVRDIMSQEVRVKDGQTLVLGGLFTEQEQSQISKVPYLAETPVLGALFRNTLKGRSRTETMLLITPKIVEEEPISSPALSGKASPTM